MNQLICIDESSSLEFAGTEMAPQKCPKGLINKGLHRWGAFPYLLGKTRTTRQKKKMQGPMSAWRALIIDYVIGFENEVEYSTPAASAHRASWKPYPRLGLVSAGAD